MKKNEQRPSDLENELKHIAKNGIQADNRRIKEDMCAQFSDPHEWIREYAVNAADAGAKNCRIYGFENEKDITIAIEDDGHGMDKQGVLDFCSIYRSVKRGDPLKIVGCHGVGKLSPAVIPGQRGFSMTTSTGMECWRMKAGKLLENTPIKLERVESIPPHGTRFEITFKKTGEMRVHAELEKIAHTLVIYMSYHPLNIVVFEIDGNDPDAPKWAKPIRKICGDWTNLTERFSLMYNFELTGNKYEAVLGLSKGTHEVYHNRVFVTKQYNLLAHGLPMEVNIPHLKIRLDSPGFKLPFGRNCLTNEEVLIPVARYIRQELLPDYFDKLCDIYEKGLLKEHKISHLEAEDFACAMVRYFSSSKNARWSKLPIFAALNYPQLSFARLWEIVRETGVLYIEGKDNTGMDYSAFKEPVLSNKCRSGGLELLNKIFGNKIVVLGKDDRAIEVPETIRSEIGQREKRFEKFLGFHPEALQKGVRQKGPGNVSKTILPRLFSEEIQKMMGISEESNRAKDNLSSLKWRVNYLVKHDGKSPCRTHRFLFKNNTVVLNLNHSDVKKLILLSDSAPALAGHWALAMSFCDSNRILPHLTPEAREDLILLDAMAKVGSVKTMDNKENASYKKKRMNRFRKFIRDIDDYARWIN